MSGFFCVLSPPLFLNLLPPPPFRSRSIRKDSAPVAPLESLTLEVMFQLSISLSIHLSISLSYLCIDSLTPLSLPRDTSIWPWAIRVITGLPPLATTSHMSARLLVGFNTATLTPPTLVSARSIPLSCARLSSFSWFFCFCNTHAHAHAHTHTRVV